MNQYQTRGLNFHLSNLATYFEKVFLHANHRSEVHFEFRISDDRRQRISNTLPRKGTLIQMEDFRSIY